MNRETQDNIWAILPERYREGQRKHYRKSKCGQYSEGYDVARRDIFGEHNLTSDTEPEEMLMVSKSKVTERIKYLYSHPAHIAAHKADERADELRSLFGDKRLFGKPNKEEQAKPKFEKGQKVRFEYSKDSHSRVCEINDIRVENGIVEYQIGSVWAKEPYLKPYTEEAKDAYEQYRDAKAEEYRNLSQEIANYDIYESNALNCKALYDALCDLESASVKVRKALISIQNEK